ncbi:Transmembrane protein 161A/B [Trema orientale]|uniref:Transmembrane protein 161A/B n=1 Tax=Trema orientale TaxID=63057 RepID=A0A2P5CZG5_TREOI|nr:Transmembrane protein 161A/B [Trema orientale]
MIEFFQTYKYLLLQASLSIPLTLLLTFLKIPVFFLHGLFTYIHPDNLSNGVKAAIRRPESSDSASGVPSKTSSELRKRTKSKDKFEFDESNAQIFRLKLDEAHLQSRLYFNEYRNVFTISFVAIACFFLQVYLNRVSEKSGFFSNGVFVPVLLGFVGVFKLVILMGKLSFEKSASRRSEKQLSVLFGILGVILGSMTSYTFTSSVLDFNFGSIDGFGRFFIAVFMGCSAAFLFIPAVKSARSFWLGTDQLRSNLSMITCGWFARVVLYANYLVTTLTALLWIKPLSEMLVNKNMNETKSAGSINEIGNAERLLGNVGFSPSDFGKLRICFLFFSGVLQLVALRPNLQMYLNEALLSWYQRLHASKVPDLDFSRAKVFLHNHYLCLVVLQFLAPPVLILLFLGFSQVDGGYLHNFQNVCSLLPCSAFVKEAAFFMAWWVIFVSAVYTSATIVLFRRGDLYVS